MSVDLGTVGDVCTTREMTIGKFNTFRHGSFYIVFKTKFIIVENTLKFVY
jgi:hypothetical protein